MNTPKAVTVEDVRAFVLEKLEMTEWSLGTATLQVTLAEAFITWRWEYADSMTQDFGTVSLLADGTLEIHLDPDSSSYVDPDAGEGA